MKRISLFVVLLAGVLASSLLAAEGPNSLDLDGRGVVVRLYRCGAEDQSAFEQTVLYISDANVVFDLSGADESSFIVIFSKDQRDEVVKSVLGNRVYGWAYKKGLGFALLQEAHWGRDSEQECDWIFLDGLGEPIAEASVGIYLVSKAKRVLIGRSKVDEKGRLKGLPCRRNVNARVKDGSYEIRSAGFYFKVFHPDYGSAFVQPDLFTSYQEFYVPLVPAGSEADKRSIWGQVLDDKERGVPGARIHGIAIITVGGDWIRSVSGQRQGVIADDSGRFRMYLPASEEAHEVGIMVPPKTKYQVKIEPPQEFHLLPSWLEIMNGQNSKIKLQYAGYFHTFSFEDSNGPITAPEVLEDIRVVVRRSGKHNDLWIRYKQWKEGGWLPLGRYDASHDRYKFQGIDVTPDSPEQLIFRVEPTKTYKGRVVNGITGEPMPGAFVVATERCNGQSSLAWLSTEEWKILHQLKTEIVLPENATESAPGRVDVIFSAKRLLRADEDGRFEIKVPPTTTIKRLVAFEENYLAFHAPTSWAKQAQNAKYDLGNLKLFPAAKVRVLPDFTADPNRLLGMAGVGWFLVGPQWFINKQDSPSWTEQLLAACGQDADEGVFRGYRLAVTKIQGDYRSHRFLVPAGVNLRLNLRTLDRIEWGPITIAEGIKLEQGQLLDLGRHKIVEPFLVLVEVLNSSGDPVEGVPVLVCGGYDPAVSSTDENGIALFEFVGYSKGEFIVECNAGGDANKPAMRQILPYEIKGPEDANSVFTLKVSDEMLYHLFK